MKTVWGNVIAGIIITLVNQAGPSELHITPEIAAWILVVLNTLIRVVQDEVIKLGKQRKAEMK